MRTEDFKMGDRVRVIGTTQHGREGRVDKIAPQLVQFPILVVFDHSNSGVFGFAPHELELQQPTKEAS